MLELKACLEGVCVERLGLGAFEAQGPPLGRTVASLRHACWPPPIWPSREPALSGQKMEAAHQASERPFPIWLRRVVERAEGKGLVEDDGVCAVGGEQQGRGGWKGRGTHRQEGHLLTR